MMMMMFDEDIGLDCCFEGIRGQRIPTSFVRLLVSGQILVCEYPDVVSLVVRMKDCIHALEEAGTASVMLKTFVLTWAYCPLSGEGRAYPTVVRRHTTSDVIID
jgi:hypothetical protein